MSEQELKAILPTAFGNRMFDRGLVEGLEAALKAMNGAPPEVLEPLRALAAMAAEQKQYHERVIAQMDTPESRAEMDALIERIYSGEEKMVPMADVLKELGILPDEDRNGVSHREPG